MAKGLDKARLFILGCDKITIAADHKPLLKILSDRSLETIPNARLRNLKEKALRYRFKVVFIPNSQKKTRQQTRPHGARVVRKRRRF